MVASDPMWTILFYIWIATFLLPIFFLLVAFLLKTRRERGVWRAVHDIDRYYPFPPRHRSLYRSILGVYERNSLVDGAIDLMRERLDKVQDDLKNVRGDLEEVGSESDPSRLAEKLAVHLSAHLVTPNLLTQKQIEKYNMLRGYSDDPCANVPDGHDPAMWRRHNRCE